VLIATLTVPNRVEFVRPATMFLVHTARAVDVPAADEPVFEVAIGEAISNAVRHGGGDTMTCEVELKARMLTVRVIDGGQGFHLPPLTLPDPSREQIENVPASGYGLPIIRSVFPNIRVIQAGGRFGVELGLNY
jgi:anti-sigma regulatory factor (Ser/Thr protein kinase)